MGYEATLFAADRRKLIKGLSVQAAKMFEDESLDWVYVDALHDHKSVIKDLEAWYPKVRWGGFLSGDDYGDAQRTPMMTAERYRRGIGWDPKGDNWGVISAVNQFFRH